MKSEMTQADFSKGKVWKNIISQSVPLIFAQLVLMLYNIVDRIYIGHLKEEGSMALTGVGLAFPITTLIAAFTYLFGTGGAPLFSMARGAKEEEKAEKILGQVVMLLTVSSVILFALLYIFRVKILYLFGAGDDSIGYADSYLRIYLFGTLFSMFATGLNSFINAQGFPKIGMGTIVIGAVFNIILDPVFIYLLNLKVEGAAIATVISQFMSFLWVLYFFFSKKNMYRIKVKNMIPEWGLIKKISTLGLAGCIMQATNCAVQIVCNKTLNMYGGDLYVGIMTVINSVREILSLPASCVGGGSQPILSYNYGARRFDRVKSGIKFTTFLATSYMLVAWIIVIIIPHAFMSVFTKDTKMIELGTTSLRLYFFGFFFMALQFSAQSTFTALGCAKRAVFFSIFRKVIIVVPLTLWLPAIGFGVKGVFLAEPISNAIGSTASFVTMWFTLYRKLPDTKLSDDNCNQ